MSVLKQFNGKWLFEKYLEGGRAIRKAFATKAEVSGNESYIEEQAAQSLGLLKIRNLGICLICG